MGWHFYYCLESISDRPARWWTHSLQPFTSQISSDRQGGVDRFHRLGDLLWILGLVDHADPVVVDGGSPLGDSGRRSGTGTGSLHTRLACPAVHAFRIYAGSLHH